MKMLDVALQEGGNVEAIKTYPIIRDNFNSIVKDFERMYFQTLNQELPPQVTTEIASQMKSDLFCAFAIGCQNAMEAQSILRQDFIIPQELMEEIEKKVKEASSGIIGENTDIVESSTGNGPVPEIIV